MADTIVLMNKGEIQQKGSPEEIYDDPNNVFTAQFIGTPPMNLLAMENGCRLGYRPEVARLRRGPAAKGYCAAGSIVTREMLGSETHYKVRLQDGDVMVKTQEKGFSVGEAVYLSVEAGDMYFFGPDEQRIREGQDRYRDCLEAAGGAL